MSLFIEEEGNIKLDFDTEEIAALVIDAALELADCPYEAEINLLLTENAQIHEMNLEQRGIDRPTDVLSFPMIEYEEPGDFSVIDEESAEAFNPESGELMLGDIVISKEKVLSQAEEYGHLPKREYAFLIAHSMLHLFGYDHMVDEERVVMEAKQKEIMEKVEEGGTIAGKGAEGDVRGSFSKYADLTDRAIHVQKQIIRKLAENESCVIIGRSADYILKDTKDIDLLRAFIYAPDEVRIHNIMESHNLSEKDAKILLLEKDKRYHKRHLALTGSNRGDRHNRDILINSDFLGIQGTAEYLEDLIAKKYGKKEA